MVLVHNILRTSIQRVAHLKNLGLANILK